MNCAPVLFVSHGSPMFALEPGKLGPNLLALGQSLPRPRAVLVVSPHWMTSRPLVMTTVTPATVHDFGGFAPELYEMQYPASGAPELAQRAVEVLNTAGFAAQSHDNRGLDHGAWVPLRYLYPEADVPVFQVSLPAGLDGQSAYAFGQALAPLRDEGVLIVGSGSLTHNLYEWRQHATQDAVYAQAFSSWVHERLLAHDHAAIKDTMTLAPHATRAHPTTEHLLPLMIAAGAAGEAASVERLEGGITYGVLSMDSFVFDR